MNKINVLAFAVLIGLFTVGIKANSAVLKINKEQSSFSKDYWFCLEDCNAAEQYQISGMIEVSFDIWGETIDRILFDPVVVITTAPDSEPFRFPDYPAIFEAGTFSASGNPCYFWSGPGTCMAIGNFGYSSGEFDGTNLTLIGAAGIDELYSYHYTISAALVPPPAAVPLPTPLSALLIASVILLVLLKDRISVRKA